MNVGEVDANGIKTGFLVIGKSTGGTECLKPISKKEFVDKYGDQYESKSQAAKAFYANLGTFTMVGRADFNAKLDKGYKLMARKETKSGRFTYNLASPKGDTGGAVNEAVIKENAALKAQLAELVAKVAALGAAK